MTYMLKDLRSVTEEELIAAHDDLAEDTVAGVNYYLDELARRDTERTNKALVRLTWALVALTVVLTILTLLLVYDQFFHGFDGPIF